jgi:hypothetical protein
VPRRAFTFFKSIAGATDREALLVQQFADATYQ